MASHIAVITTCPSNDIARRIAERLVDEHLAACVAVMPQIESVYRWKNERQSTIETMLFIKTRQDAYERVEQAILSEHPYDLPEIIAIPVSSGLPGYLAWIDECLDMN